MLSVRRPVMSTRVTCRRLAPLSKEEASDDARATAALMAYFDLVVWAGDLNYRVEIERAAADVLIAERNFKVMQAL